MSDKFEITGFCCYWCGTPLNNVKFTFGDTVIETVDWTCPNCGKFGLKISEKGKE